MDVLIVDDESSLRTIISAVLKKADFKCDVAASAEEAIELLKDNPYKVLVTDYNMPGKNGIELIEVAKEVQPWINPIMITAFGTMDTVIEAMRLGVQDFLTKPFDNNELIERVVALSKVESQQDSESTHSIIGESPQVKEMIQIASKSAKSEANVLLLGESGTGKEVLAKHVHEVSDRKDGPFVAVNCGAIPENLMESEIFGYKKGAFSGAVSDRPGKVELAEKGTLFLDEIGEMPLSMQVKLLRVLQEKQVERLGDDKPTSVDFRLIAATHRNLEGKVRTGEFREDLFFRLNVVPIKLPSLNERGDDVLLLADFFLKKWNKKLDIHYILTPEQKKNLMAHTWPGNIRELENTIERAVVLGQNNELYFESKQVDKKVEPKPVPGEKSLKDLAKEGEKDIILQALEENRWNKTKTAKFLGISRRSLLYKVKEFEIS